MLAASGSAPIWVVVLAFVVLAAVLVWRVRQIRSGRGSTRQRRRALLPTEETPFQAWLRKLSGDKSSPGPGRSL